MGKNVEKETRLFGKLGRIKPYVVQTMQMKIVEGTDLTEVDDVVQFG